MKRQRGRGSAWDDGVGGDRGHGRRTARQPQVGAARHCPTLGGSPGARARTGPALEGRQRPLSHSFIRHRGQRQDERGLGRECLQHR